MHISCLPATLSPTSVSFAILLANRAGPHQAKTCLGLPLAPRNAEVWEPLRRAKKHNPHLTEQREAQEAVYWHMRDDHFARAKCFKSKCASPVSRTNRGDGLLLRSRVPKCICFAFRASDFFARQLFRIMFAKRSSLGAFGFWQRRKQGNSRPLRFFKGGSIFVFFCGNLPRIARRPPRARKVLNSSYPSPIFQSNQSDESLSCPFAPKCVFFRRRKFKCPISQNDPRVILLRARKSELRKHMDIHSFSSSSQPCATKLAQTVAN